MRHFGTHGRRRRRGAAALALALALGGCGELTSGGLGEVEVYATADEEEASQPTSAPALRAPGTSELLLAEGQLAVRFQVFLQADSDGQWIELTDGVRDLTLTLSGGGERRAGVRFVSAGRYSRLRVVFHELEAFVTGGLIVDEVPVTGAIDVDLGAGTLTVEREVLIEVEGDERLDLLIDLNADVWLPTLSLATRTVAGAQVAEALAVRAR